MVRRRTVQSVQAPVNHRNRAVGLTPADLARLFVTCPECGGRKSRENQCSSRHCMELQWAAQAN
jgi:hypothetical protein